MITSEAHEWDPVDTWHRAPKATETEEEDYGGKRLHVVVHVTSTTSKPLEDRQCLVCHRSTPEVWFLAMVARQVRATVSLPYPCRVKFKVEHTRIPCLEEVRLPMFEIHPRSPSTAQADQSARDHSARVSRDSLSSRCHCTC
jgi:hypothetical protein